MNKGQLVEFRIQGERRLAVIDHPEGKKDWIAIDAEGHGHKLRPQRVEYAVADGPYQPTDIAAFLQSVQALLDPASLEVAWELLVDEGAGISAQDMAQLLFSEQGPAVCYAAHTLLVEDKLFFKKKGNLYEPRPEHQVSELKHQIEVEAQRARDTAAFNQRLQQALAQGNVRWDESDHPRLEALEQLALNPDSAFPALAKEILTQAKRLQTSQAAFELLVEIGWWDEHENLFLRRSMYPLHFPSQVLADAQQVLMAPSKENDHKRRDLTHLKVYTIDDESTKEIDDGLSVEYLGEQRFRVWIHIADPSELITPGDTLDLEARRRSTSLYLPTGTLPMFPPELATGPMSLVQGQVGPALSFGVILSTTGEIEDYQICISFIKPTYRLTYHDVDEILQLGVQAEPEIADLYAEAERRLRWRQSQGAVFIQMPESVITVNDQGKVHIEILDDSPARQLVAEMMILAGEVAGRFSQAQKIPVPYRGQPQPELPSEEVLMKLPSGPVRACALRRCMPRSEMGIQPMRHASLGLDVYTQVTSPIRRYMDLLAHYQIKAYLQGEDLPFSTEALQKILYSVVTSAYEATLVERQTKRYWGLEYLRRQGDQVWPCLFLRWLREDDNLGLILVDDLGLELPHRFERAIVEGDRLELQVSKCDPHRDIIRFQEVNLTATETA